VKSSTIVSLAILKANADILHKDYIENFVPLVAQCIKEQAEEVVSVIEVQRSLKDKFGLDLPYSVIDTILRRVKRAKYTRRAQGVYFRNEQELEKLNFQDIQIQLVIQYDKIVELLRSFCEEEYGRKISTQDAEDALLAYINENQIAIVGLRSTNNLIPPIQYPLQEAKYLVGSFVKHLQITKSPFFRYFENVVYGNMIANAVFLPDISQSPVKFRNTSVYFDTSFILFALGHAGEARQAPTIELLNLLKRVDAKLHCFQHTIDEIRGVLDACSQKLSSGQLKDAYGATMLYFISKRYKASDISLLLTSLESDINALGITSTKKPDYKEREYIIDETELGEVLRIPDEVDERWTYRNEMYRNPLALKRDVDSISAIMRLRRGALPFYYEDCGAIFITTNRRLNRISRKLFYRDAQSDTVPPCQVDQAFTNIIWLKQPNSAPDLPRKRIIADYFAATQPSDKLIRAYYAEIEKLKTKGKYTDEQYFLLRHTINVPTILAEQTLGIEDAFTEGTIDEILEVIQENILRGKEEEHNRNLEAKQIELESAYQESAELEHLLKENLRKGEGRKANILKRAETIGKITSNIIFWVLFIIIFVATLYTFPWGFPETENATPQYIRTTFFVILIIFFLLSISNMIFGTHALDVRKWVQQKTARYIEGILTKLSE